ncbi:MAG: type II toxin-antitoxin system ParD family antitoxin [Pirellulales bacterium]
MSTVPPEFAPFVEYQISSGRYQSPDDVIAAGLRLLQDREARLEALRNELRPAIERLDRGEGITIAEEDLDAFFDGIMEDVDRKLDQEQRAEQ